MNEKKRTIKSTNLILSAENPQDPWNCKWIIFLKKMPDTKVGWISFEGERSLGTVSISIELEPLYRNRGLGTEAIKAFSDWGMSFSNVYEISAKCSPENDSYIYALEKSGFVIRNKTKEEEIYSIIKPKPSWTGLYIIIGIIIGFILGILFGNLYIGFITGVLICLLSGLVMEQNSKKEREKVTGKKE